MSRKSSLLELEPCRALTAYRIFIECGAKPIESLSKHGCVGGQVHPEMIGRFEKGTRHHADFVPLPQVYAEPVGFMPPHPRKQHRSVRLAHNVEVGAGIQKSIHDGAVDLEQL